MAAPTQSRLRVAVRIAAALVALALAAPAVASAAGEAEAATWLAATQNRDGGFGPAPGDPSAGETTAWAMLGLEAAGRNPLDLAYRGRTPIDFLRGDLADLRTPGDLARTILALEGAGVDPRDFGGGDLVAKLLARRRADGSYEGWPGTTAYAAIALRAAGATGSLPRTLDWLRGVQNEDGGWGDAPGTPSTSDGTGAVLQALPRRSAASKAGVAYLRRAQQPGGGFALGGNSLANSQSTAWAIQGLIAAGHDPGEFRRGGTGAPEYLAARQAPDGHYAYSRSSDQNPIWVTSYALVATAGDFFPIRAPRRRSKPTPAGPAVAPAPVAEPQRPTPEPKSPQRHAPAPPPENRHGNTARLVVARLLERALFLVADYFSLLVGSNP